MSGHTCSLRLLTAWSFSFSAVSSLLSAMARRKWMSSITVFSWLICKRCGRQQKLMVLQSKSEYCRLYTRHNTCKTQGGREGGREGGRGTEGSGGRVQRVYRTSLSFISTSSEWRLTWSSTVLSSSRVLRSLSCAIKSNIAAI